MLLRSKASFKMETDIEEIMTGMTDSKLPHRKPVQNTSGSDNSGVPDQDFSIYLVRPIILRDGRRCRGSWDIHWGAGAFLAQTMLRLGISCCGPARWLFY